MYVAWNTSPTHWSLDVSLIVLRMNTGQYYTLRKRTEKPLYYTVHAWVTFDNIPGFCQTMFHTMFKPFFSFETSTKYLPFSRLKRTINVSLKHLHVVCPLQVTIYDVWNTSSPADLIAYKGEMLGTMKIQTSHLKLHLWLAMKVTRAPLKFASINSLITKHCQPHSKHNTFSSEWDWTDWQRLLLSGPSAIFFVYMLHTNCGGVYLLRNPVKRRLGRIRLQRKQAVT